MLIDDYSEKQSENQLEKIKISKFSSSNEFHPETACVFKCSYDIGGCRWASTQDSSTLLMRRKVGGVGSDHFGIKKTGVVTMKRLG